MFFSHAFAQTSTAPLLTRLSAAADGSLRASAPPMDPVEAATSVNDLSSVRAVRVISRNSGYGFDLEDSDGLVLIAQFHKGCAAAKTRSLCVGDVLLDVDRTPIASSEEAARLLEGRLEFTLRVRAPRGSRLVEVLRGPADRLGCELKRGARDAVVVGRMQGAHTLAARSGLATGDVVVAVNGRSVACLSPSQVEGQFSSLQGKIALRVQSAASLPSGCAAAQSPLQVQVSFC